MALTATAPASRREPASLQTAGDYASFRFTAMGSPCQVVFRAASRAASAELERAARAWVSDFEAQCSRFRPQSVVSRLNAGAGGPGVETDETLDELLALCDWFHWRTGGVFDPTVAPLLGLWDYHHPNPSLPSPEAVRKALGKVGWKRVERRPGWIRLPEAGMGIDLGGIGKEYAVDRVAALASQRGIEDFVVDFGHDLRVRGRPPEGGPWRVGLEDPLRPGRCWCGVALSDGAVCTSGDYLRRVEIGGVRYGHIIDPRTGYPVSNGCRAASVIAPSCTEAGMLSRAAFVLGPEQGLDLIAGAFGAGGCIWTDRGVVETRRFHEYVMRGRG